MLESSANFDYQMVAFCNLQLSSPACEGRVTNGTPSADILGTAARLNRYMSGVGVLLAVGWDTAPGWMPVSTPPGPYRPGPLRMMTLIVSPSLIPLKLGGLTTRYRCSPTRFAQPGHDPGLEIKNDLIQPRHERGSRCLASSFGPDFPHLGGCHYISSKSEIWICVFRAFSGMPWEFP